MTSYLCRVYRRARGALETVQSLSLGGKKLDDPHSFKFNEITESSFQPLVSDTFKNSEGFSRVAFLDGNGCMMLRKVVSCERKENTGAAGDKKK